MNKLMTSLPIRVDIWSDFACPFCYIGKRRFENALKKFSHKDQVQVIFRNFELNPHQKMIPGRTKYIQLSEKYGMTIEKAKGLCDNMTKQAKELGLDYKFDTMIIGNTHDAHRLEQYAKTQGKSDEIVEEIMHAYYTDSKDIGDHETLTQLAVKVGLDDNEVRKVLSEGRFNENVKKDIKEASELGVNGVPYFLFNKNLEISGAQPEEVFLRVFEKLWKEKKKEEKVGNGKGDAGGKCENGVCKL